MTETMKKTILIVEDEVLIAMLERKQLENENYRVLHAVTGEKAIALVCEEREPVDLILMDIDLGDGMDGTEAAARILMCTDVPILFLSSHTEKDIVSRTESITNYGYVVKNSSFTVLDASIKMAFKLFNASKCVNEERMKNEAAYEEMQVINESLLKTQGDLMQTEKSLRRSEEKYRYIDESSLDSIYSYDRGGRFTHANRALCKLLGLPYEAILGKTHEELGFPAKQCGEWAALHRRVYDTDGTVVAVTETPIPDSPSIYFEVALNPIHGDDGGIIGISGTTRDITERVKTEKAAEESRELFSLLFDQSPYPVMIVDCADGNFLDVNEAMVEKVEYAKDELVGKSAVELGVITPGVERLTREAIAKEGRYSDLEVAMVSKSGRARIGLASGRVVRLHDHDYLFQTIVDVTEGKRVRDALERSEERFRLAMQASRDGLWDWSVPDGDVYYSPAWAHILGEEGVPDTLAAWEERLHPEDKPAVLATLKAHLEGSGETWQREHRLRMKDGTWKWVLGRGSVVARGPGGEPLRMVGTMTDISDRKAVERALAEKEEKYRFALEGSDLGEWDWDYPSGRVGRNARWAEMLGFSPEELEATIQQGVDLMHPDDVEMVRRAVREHLDGAVDHYYIEYRLKTKAGGYKWIRDCGKVMVRDAEGKPLRLCGTHEDVDERKKARDRIELLLAEKELVLKEVHHRIINNMNTIRSLLELQELSIEEPSARPALREAASRVRSMSLLYDKLYRSSEYKELSLRDYLPALAREAVANFPNAGLVRLETEVEDLPLAAKRLQPVGIIVNELLTNCMKYAFAGRPGGSITLSAALRDGLVAISVRDDGVGMPEAVSCGDSTGFGLQLVQALAAQLKGTIRIECARGTAVVLEFGAR
ncbi:MAG: PAS domain S-box protein [Spirochaetaceae bacterium]|nr:PAS domain S-box protein [Spirochaetaceae bacterium]